MIADPVATVVVVTWQGAHLLGPCLDALAAQSLPAHQFRVVVVDNASTDGTAEAMARRPVEVVTSSRNLGFAGGATLGLRNVSTPYAVVLNNDARPESAWLERLLDGFEAGVAAVTSKVLLEPRYVVVRVPAADPTEVGAVAVDGADVTTAVVARPDGVALELAIPAADGTSARLTVHDAAGRPLLQTDIAAHQGRVDVLNSTGGVLTPTGHGADRGYLEVDRGQYDRATDVFAVCGAAAAFRTDLGSAAGWFDPWLFAYYEDLDLSWRLRRAGWEIRFAPEARVRHRHAATSRVGSDFFLFYNRRNRLATLTRNATGGQLLGFLAASWRPREAPDAVLLGPPAEEARRTGRPHRGKAAAARSYAVRVPRLLTQRRFDRRRLGTPVAPSAKPPR